jgi:hypothetical protein
MFSPGWPFDIGKSRENNMTKYTDAELEILAITKRLIEEDKKRRQEKIEKEIEEAADRLERATREALEKLNLPITRENLAKIFEVQCDEYKRQKDELRCK